MTIDVSQVPKRAAEDETDPDLMSVPDCWHVAQAVRNGDEILPDRREFAAQIILETWHLAHRLRRHAQEVKRGARFANQAEATSSAAPAAAAVDALQKRGPE